MKAILTEEKEMKKTKNMILKVAKSMNIKRMPSRSEIELYSGSTSISNRISRSGGFYAWAKMIGFEMKGSETEKGREFEIKCKNYLESIGYAAELTPVKFPYDVLVKKHTKIDVKISNGYNGKNGFFFTFNLEYRLPKCDFYVLYCDGCELKKVLVIPAHKVYGKTQISVGKKSIYDVYKDRWDLIENHIKIIDAVEAS